MTLVERLEKVRLEIENLKEKEKKIKEKTNEKKSEEKKILEEIEKERLKKEAENNKKIAAIVSETFGEVGEKELQLFTDVMRRNMQNLLNTKHQMEGYAQREESII